MSSDMTHSSFCNWIRYKHLVLIDTLARTRNMHATASRMNLSQPALSKMLRDLEEQFGFALFERLPRSMPPTELGEYVVRYAQNALADSHTFVDQVNRWGQSRLQWDFVDNGPTGGNSWEVKLDHTLPFKPGKRLSVSLNHGSLSYSGEAATRTSSVSFNGGIDLTQRLSLDGSARYGASSLTPQRLSGIRDGH